MSFTTHDIFNWLDLESTFPKTDVTGVTIDSRTVRQNNLFVALKGEHADGHAFVDQALQQGACAALVTADYAASVPVSRRNRLIAVEDPLAGLQRMATCFRKTFSGPVIAVTGSNGKTTTKEMVSAVLAVKFHVHKTEGNLNNHIGVPMTLLSCSDKTDIMVVEMGMNHPGEIGNLCRLAEPTHGVITNVGRGHMGFFRSLEDVGKAKAELLEFLKDSGSAFINGDDAILRKYRDVASHTQLFGFDAQCHVRAERLESRGEFPAMRIDGTDVRLKLPGEHQLSNALAATAVGMAMQIPLSAIARTLSELQSFPQRMEKIEVGGIQILNDVYNANPDSMMAAVKTLISMPAQHHIAILGCMKELGKFSVDEHSRLGEWMMSLPLDYFFGVGEDMAIAVQSINRNGRKRGTHALNAADVLAPVMNCIRPGDAVLVKGSRSMRMETVVNGLIEAMKTGIQE